MRQRGYGSLLLMYGVWVREDRIQEYSRATRWNDLFRFPYFFYPYTDRYPSMANYLRIDGEAEVYNLDYIRRMWKVDEATEETEDGLPVIYMELDNDRKLHIKFETKEQRDETFYDLLNKMEIFDIVTKTQVDPGVSTLEI
jgi:hypothetical protein